MSAERPYIDKEHPKVCKALANVAVASRAEAREAGVKESTLDVLPDWRESAPFTDEQRAALLPASRLDRQRASGPGTLGEGTSFLRNVVACNEFFPLGPRRQVTPAEFHRPWVFSGAWMASVRVCTVSSGSVHARPREAGPSTTCHGRRKTR